MSTKADYRKANKEFLKNFATNENVVKLEHGVLLQVVLPSDGPTPQENSVIVVQYQGKLIDGAVFDSTYERSCPDAIRLRETIEGWRIAFPHIHKGEKCIIVIPADMAYGKQKVENIPANYTLVFEVELVDIH